MKAREGKEDFLVAIEEEAPHFGSADGVPLFDSENKPTRMVNEAIKFLESFQRDMLVTRELMKVVKDSNLLGIKNIEHKQAREVFDTET